MANSLCSVVRVFNCKSSEVHCVYSCRDIYCCCCCSRPLGAGSWVVRWREFCGITLNPNTFWWGKEEGMGDQSILYWWIISHSKGMLRPADSVVLQQGRRLYCIPNPRPWQSNNRYAGVCRSTLGPHSIIGPLLYWRSVHYDLMHVVTFTKWSQCSIGLVLPLCRVWSG